MACVSSGRHLLILPYTVQLLRTAYEDCGITLTSEVHIIAMLALMKWNILMLSPGEFYFHGGSSVQKLRMGD
jgi:hypothetical protein